MSPATAWSAAPLFDGDLAVVDCSLDPRGGHVVVVDGDGGRSFKVRGRRGGRTTPALADPAYPLFDLAADALVGMRGVLAGSISL